MRGLPLVDKSLSDVRKVQIVVEFGCGPDFADFDSAVIRPVCSAIAATQQNHDIFSVFPKINPVSGANARPTGGLPPILEWSPRERWGHIIRHIEAGTI